MKRQLTKEEETLETIHKQQQHLENHRLSQPLTTMEDAIEESSKTKKATNSQQVRHVEKRRTGTCRFADRIAKISILTYKSVVPKSFRDKQQTCIATIVAHFEDSGDIQVMALGVGTKFLPDTILRQEEQESEVYGYYGRRVRDCHAEVLARRAFRRQLSLEIQSNLKQVDNDETNGLLNESTYRPILRRIEDNKQSRYQLIPGVTLHMYASSAPCGNATLKKFTKMKKETYNDKLGENEWPEKSHETIAAHSIHLGQFSLLVKKDTNQTNSESSPLVVPSKSRPADKSDEWCPPGTSITSFDKGSVHSCSDKICRWNCIGIQGSLLAALLENPLYTASLTVGRKFTECICRRAVCCRASPPDKFKPKDFAKYKLHHPAIMGTAVYMDETGVIDMSLGKEFGQDVRFYGSLCFAWWASLETEAECIDGATGFAVSHPGCKSPLENGLSRICTYQLLRLFSEIATPTLHQWDASGVKDDQFSLNTLRTLKRNVSPEYEIAKDDIMTKHRTFKQWRRRECEGIRRKATERISD